MSVAQDDVSGMERQDTRLKQSQIQQIGYIGDRAPRSAHRAPRTTNRAPRTEPQESNQTESNGPERTAALTPTRTSHISRPHTPGTSQTS
jgi:hypothetical protein